VQHTCCRRLWSRSRPHLGGRQSWHSNCGRMISWLRSGRARRPRRARAANRLWWCWRWSWCSRSTGTRLHGAVERSGRLVGRAEQQGGLLLNACDLAPLLPCAGAASRLAHSRADTSRWRVRRGHRLGFDGAPIIASSAAPAASSAGSRSNRECAPQRAAGFPAAMGNGETALPWRYVSFTVFASGLFGRRYRWRGLCPAVAGTRCWTQRHKHAR
jgi:hypothetical protein